MLTFRNPARWLLPLALSAALVAVELRPLSAQTISLGELSFTNKGLVAVGSIPANVRDKFKETTISASGMTVDLKAWRKTGDSYSGVIYLLPDRGYNVSGTIDYRPRIHKLSVALTPGNPHPGKGPPGSVVATLLNTILLTDAAGAPLTGLDPPERGIRPVGGGFPDLPQAANGRISLDSEAMVLLPNGEFFISDEYGPYIYRFSASGRMIAAIRPPQAFIPLRNGVQNFSSNNPGPGAPSPQPADPEFGRQNNQGFEGLSLTPDGKTLVAILQSATRQDGGSSAATRQHTRMLFYDITDLDRPKLAREHVVALPAFTGDDGKKKIAAQSELLALDENYFLLLCRDGLNGYGTPNAKSFYRRIELIDTSRATNIAGTKYDGSVPLAPGGKLEPDITPAQLSSFIDINDNSQLARYGLHNGPPNDRTNLSEKWEALGLVPALDPANPRDFFLFVANDNDFITQNGFQAGARYKDPSGANIDTRFLVYRVTLPQLPK